MSAPHASKLFRGTERFEILGALGSGASGTVYEVLDRVRKTRVALKTLHELDAEQRYRFKREFRALSNVHDEHLAELHELVADSDPWFFTMELIVGTDFMSYVRGSPSRRPAPATTTIRGRTSSAPRRAGDSLPCLAPPDLTRVRRAFAELARGVSALHRRGLLHRDLKPSNVLVTTHGRVVLVDFGIVAELNSSQSSSDLSAVVGTPAYMAPEQGMGEGVSAATDWYAVGVMLFEALTGKLPFQSAGFDCIAEKLERPAPHARELVPSVPDDLDELCAAMLAREAGERPTFAEIVERLDAQTIQVAAPAFEAANDLFVGRDREVAELASALAQVRPDSPVVVHLSGTSGMGKSTVLQHFLHDLTVDERALVLSGRCCERESVPFKALDDVIDALAMQLAALADDDLPVLDVESSQALLRIFPVLAQVPSLSAVALDAGEASLDSGSLLSVRSRAVAALRALLQHLSKERPVVLAIDDAQWGDEDSAHLLLELMAPPEPPGVLAVLAYRREYVGKAPLLEAKPSGSGVGAPLHQVSVDALPEERARALAAHWLARAPEDPAVTSIVSEAGGSPFLLSEFARHVRAVGVPSAGLSLAAVLRARFAELEPAPRKMLEALAVAARPVDPFLAARAAALEPEEGAAALRALRRAHLVRDSEARAGASRIETFHDRLREALMSTMPGEQLRAQHGQFVEALNEIESSDVEALFEHCRGAGDRTRAADYAAQAAHEAVRGLAFMRAAELFEAAEQLAEQGDARVHGFRVARADALACAGRRKDAGDAYVFACETADAVSDAKLKLECAAVQQYLTGGHFDVGMRIAEHTARSLGMPLAETRTRALLWMAARLGWLKLRGTGFVERAEHQIPQELLTQIDAAYRVGRGVAITDPIRGSELFLRTVSLALESGEIKRVAVMLSCLSTLLAVEGPSDYVRSLVEQSTELALRTGDIETLAVASLGHGCMHALNGIWVPALVELERTDALFQQLRRLPTAEQKDTRSLLLVVRYYLGQMRELCQQVPAALAEAAQLGDAYSRSLLTTSKASLCWLALDQPEHHAELARTGVTTKPRGNALCIEHVLSVITLMDNDLYVGQPEHALARLIEAYPAARASLLLRMVITASLVQDVAGRTALMLALRGRDVAKHRRMALKQAAALERRRHLPFPAAIAIMLRAGEADVSLQAEAAVALYRRAAEAFDATHMALHGAVARLRLGQWLGGDEGKALRERSLCWMREQSILQPERMATMMAPTSRE